MDHVLIYGEQHLRRILTLYSLYYNETRTHLGLAKDAPLGPLQRSGTIWLTVTPHPNAEWIARQLTEAYGWQQAPRYIVRDRDRVYGDVFARGVRAMGIRDRPIAPYSPWQNGFAERLIGSIRRDCLDHVVVLGERHLHHLLKSYQQYYNEARTHLSSEKDASISRAVQTVGQTLAVPILGGLHHQHIRA